MSYESHAGTKWIPDNSEKRAARKAAEREEGGGRPLTTQENSIDVEEGAIYHHHELLMKGGFVRVSSNIIALMDEYSRGWWSLSGIVRSKNPLHGLNHHHKQEAIDLINFCQKLQQYDKKIEGFIEKIALLNTANQVICFERLFQMSKGLDNDAGTEQEFAGFLCLEVEKLQRFQKEEVKNIDVCKIHGILSIVRNLFNPQTPMGTSSFNDRIAWILKRELCLKQTINKGFTTNLETFYSRYQNDPTLLKLHALKRITVTSDSGEQKAIEIDLNKEVSVRSGAGYFWPSTKISLQTYLSQLAVQEDRASTEKFKTISQLLQSDSPMNMQQLQKLKDALSLHRCRDQSSEYSKDTQAYKEIPRGNLFYSRQATGIKILNALLTEQQSTLNHRENNCAP